MGKGSNVSPMCVVQLKLQNIVFFILKIKSVLSSGYITKPSECTASSNEYENKPWFQYKTNNFQYIEYESESRLLLLRQKVLFHFSRDSRENFKYKPHFRNYMSLLRLSLLSYLKLIIITTIIIVNIYMFMILMIYKQIKQSQNVNVMKN